jgi:hypothetical protein
MNEKQKNIWNQLLTGKAKCLAWFAILVAVTFLVTLSFRLVAENMESVKGSVFFSLMIAVVASVSLVLVIRLVRWLCCWRNFRRILFGVACFLTLILLAYAVENWRGKRAWEAHKRQWEAKGEKFTLVELAPPPVPDEQNFAMCPLLKPAMDYSRVNGRVVWNDTNGLARLEKLRANLLPGRDTNNELTLGSLDKGTFADLASWQAFYRGNTNYPQPSVSGTAAEDILFALRGVDPDYQELREAATTRKLTRFPIEYAYEPSWAILLPHLAQMKPLTLLTSVRATAELEAGRREEALADLEVGFRLTDALRDEPLLIDHLVRVVTLQINLQTLRGGLVRHAWSDEQLAEIERHLASLNLLEEYRLAMRGERALSTGGLDWMRRQKFIVFAGEEFLDQFAEGRGPGSKYLNLMPSGWYYQNMLAISEMHEDLFFPMIDEKRHRVFPDMEAKVNTALDELSRQRNPYKLFATMLVPALGRASMKSARTQTSVDAARVACALERYRLANGKLPETLDALAPRFIETIPTDVIDGKPLRYRLKADGSYVVYSVGWNQTDDGGEIGWKKSSEKKEPAVDITQGDWVWQMPGK